MHPPRIVRHNRINAQINHRVDIRRFIHRPDSHTQFKFARPCQIMRGDFAEMRTPERTARNELVRGTIAQALLDRGWGKPKVEVVNEGGGGYLEALGQANHTGSCL